MNKRDRRRFSILIAMFLACSLFYYFGEIVDMFGWTALRFSFFYGIHDTHRLLFLAPILYAAYHYGIRASVIVTIIAVNTFLPRALFISPYPDPLLRTVLFILVAGLIGHVMGWSTERRQRLVTQVSFQRDAELAILDGLTPAYLVIGPDRIVRRVSPALVAWLGEGTGQHCYQYLRKASQPCSEDCPLAAVTGGGSGNDECMRIEVGRQPGLAYPYVDTDGKVCQVVVFPGIGRG